MASYDWNCHKVLSAPQPEKRYTNFVTDIARRGIKSMNRPSMLDLDAIFEYLGRYHIITVAWGHLHMNDSTFERSFDHLESLVQVTEEIPSNRSELLAITNRQRYR